MGGQPQVIRGRGMESFGAVISKRRFPEAKEDEKEVSSLIN